MKRYLTVVGIILAAIIGLGLWLKPPLEKVREGVEEGIAAYAKAESEAGGPPPTVTQQESRDWIIAVSHVASIGDKTFYCIGGFKVTFCASPE